ncbi:hypothetical protein CO670_15515 [Rhizobium sp. J15]|uniref:hypothetical protein n=1 Tax=Rhizobium sp. J15 TaxID=2035450 RepID=UPI000BE7AFDC|nr:hypothetical protein [Rhizobium sp. J15]PDT15902.1 hypothetical protein CO670_15515 [Rhizobium sp. J15]
MPDHDFSHLHVEFFSEAIHNVRKSAEENRPVYEDVEMVRIRAAGDKLTAYVARANDPSSVREAETGRAIPYKELHAGPYEAFQRGQTYAGAGTPLSEVPFLTKAKVRELQLANVHTAEAFAALDGTNLQKLGMGARELRDQVRAWVEKISKNSDVAKLAGENEALKAKMDEMQAQIAMLMSGGNQSPGASQPPKSDDPDVNASPFFDWDDETIRLWIVEQGGDAPHHRSGHETLVRKADELNAALSKGKAA